MKIQSLEISNVSMIMPTTGIIISVIEHVFTLRRIDNKPAEPAEEVISKIGEARKPNQRKTWPKSKEIGIV